MTPFRYLLRVRYSECDAQGIVFNARWADYVDIAVGEYSRALFGSVDPAVTGIDWKLVKQTVEWKASARYDDILDCRVSTIRVGTTSFTIATELHRFNGPLLATVETVYVAFDRHGAKTAVADDYRKALERGAPHVIVDHAAALR
ncbi:MAG TPA: thioesterase family protein [Kofleriaceae bacterium]|nr:thioesterase family protein [Kofleriaceae bacterium]